MTGETRGVLFEGHEGSPLTERHLDALQEQLITNNENQMGLVKTQAMYAKFSWVVEAAKKLAWVITELEQSAEQVGAANMTLAGFLTAKSRGDDIHSIDFGNFVYPLTGECAEMLKRKSVTVRKGMFELDSFTSFNVADSGQVVYGDLTGDGRDEAVVMTHCGGMHQTTEPYVYAIKDGKPSLLARLDAGSRAFGGNQDVRIENGLLITARFLGKVACCPEFVVRTALKWGDGGFVQVGETTRVKHK